MKALNELHRLVKDDPLSFCRWTAWGNWQLRLGVKFRSKCQASWRFSLASVSVQVPQRLNVSCRHADISDAESLSFWVLAPNVETKLNHVSKVRVLRTLWLFPALMLSHGHLSHLNLCMQFIYTIQRLFNHSAPPWLHQYNINTISSISVDIGRSVSICELWAL